jgi:uncharacterized protein YkwD
LTLLLGTGAVAAGPSTRPAAPGAPTGEPAAAAAPPVYHRATLKPVAAVAAAPDIPFHDYDFQWEQQLLELANQSRQQAGLQPLTLDSGLSHAARVHAQAMLEAGQLSHQFDGEPALPNRLAVATKLQLDQEGENVAFDHDAAQGHEHLMLSPPHRANLLNPAYNVVGLGVVHNLGVGGEDRLYIVQDFGHALPSFTPAEAKNRIASAVNQTRQQARSSDLKRHDLPIADDAACSMAQADKLGTSSIQELAKRYSVLTYTTLLPDKLPEGTASAIAGRGLRSFSVGACYTRSETYATGMYWVVVTLE